jgi:hypothetical protein
MIGSPSASYVEIMADLQLGKYIRVFLTVIARLSWYVIGRSSEDAMACVLLNVCRPRHIPNWRVRSPMKSAFSGIDAVDLKAWLL